MNLATVKFNTTPEQIKQLADRYVNAPDEFETIDPIHLIKFHEVVNRMFYAFSRRVSFIFVDYEPYGLNPKLEDMYRDFDNGFIKVHTTGNDSKVWGKFYNLAFRAVHDYIHCFYRKDFTHEEEKHIFLKQLRASADNWSNLTANEAEIFSRILRSEIVYQSAYKEAYGEFHIDQKIILSDLEA